MELVVVLMVRPPCQGLRLSGTRMARALMGGEGKGKGEREKWGREGLGQTNPYINSLKARV